MSQRMLSVYLAIAAMLFFGLGCGLANRAIPTPEPIATEDLTPVETQVGAAIRTAVSGGRVTLELTEAQLTSAANQELQNQGESQVSDIQIRLDDGVMEVSGQVEQNGLNLPLTISVKIDVDAAGKPHTEIVSGQLGPFSLPQNMLEQITAQFDTMIQSQLNANASSLFIESISIDNGLITIVAQINS